MAKYIVNTAWKRKNKFDADQMREYLSILKVENADEHIYWFFIDEYTRGSKAIISSKEVFDKFLERMDVNRDISNELAVEMINEFTGTVFAQMKDLK